MFLILRGHSRGLENAT